MYQIKNIRKSICCFRVNAHRLRIERGRYLGEKPEERLCDSCDVVNNGVHFLRQCKKVRHSEIENDG